MKTMKKYIFLTLALAVCLTGCKKEPEYGDAVYMTGTLTTPTIQFNIEGEQSIGLTVSSSTKAVNPVKVQIAACWRPTTTRWAAAMSSLRKAATRSKVVT